MGKTRRPPEQSGRSWGTRARAESRAARLDHSAERVVSTVWLLRSPRAEPARAAPAAPGGAAPGPAARWWVSGPAAGWHPAIPGLIRALAKVGRQARDLALQRGELPFQVFDHERLVGRPGSLRRRAGDFLLGLVDQVMGPVKDVIHRFPQLRATSTTVVLSSLPCVKAVSTMRRACSLRLPLSPPSGTTAPRRVFQ